MPTSRRAKRKPAARRRSAPRATSQAPKRVTPARKRAARTPRRGEDASLRLALRAATLATWEWDIARDSLVWSPEPVRLLGPPVPGGYPDFRDMVIEEDRAAFVAAGRAATASGGDYRHAFRARRTDGVVREYRAVGEVERNRRGEAVRMRGVTWDVTEQSETERALRASEARFRALAEASADWIWEQDAEFRFTYMSPGILGKSAVPIERHLGRTRWDVPALNLGEADWAAHRALLEAHRPFRDFEIRRPDIDGRENWASVSGDPVFDAGGAFVGYRGTGRIITERKLAERALQASEARFRSLTELSSDWYWEQDAELRLTYVSPPSGRDAGPVPSIYLGKRDWEVDGLEPVDRSWDEVRAGRAAREPFRDLRMRRRTAGGWRVFAISGEPVFDAGGRFRGYRGVGRDLSGQVALETALRERGRELRLIMDSVPVMIAHCDRETRFLFVNRALCEGFESTPERFLGRTAREVLGERTYADIAPSLERVQRGETVRFGRRHLRNDGSARDFLVDYLPERDESGSVAGYFSFARDVTDERRAERAIRELNESLEARVRERTAALESAYRELESFSYSVSHDLKAPLRAIDGHLGVLADELGPLLPETARGRFERVSSNARFMAALIEGLLQFSRLSRHALDRRSIDPGVLVREVLSAHAETIETRGAQVRSGALPPCDADPLLLRQVFENLISNALKFSVEARPARIEIGARVDVDVNVYYVRDNGIGFDPEHAVKLFGVFERLHPPWKYEGTGIGLALARRVVERHGGRIWAESMPGQGSTFCFTLGGAGPATPRPPGH